MRIGRALIVPAILALGASGSFLTVSMTPVAAVAAPNAHVHPAHFQVGNLYYHA